MTQLFPRRLKEVYAINVKSYTLNRRFVLCMCMCVLELVDILNLSCVALQILFSSLLLSQAPICLAPSLSLSVFFFSLCLNEFGHVLSAKKQNCATTQRSPRMTQSDILEQTSIK